MHHALAASCYFADAACVQASCIQKHATVVRICGSYLWPASLPKEPMVRRGLEGLTQVGSGVFCTSVLTSGSISEGEGVSLAPAMALCLPRGLPPAESGQYVSLLLVSEQAGRQAGSLSDRRRRKTASPSHWCCTKAEGERLPPCRITGSSDTLRRA